MTLFLLALFVIAFCTVHMTIATQAVKDFVLLLVIVLVIVVVFLGAHGGWAIP